MSDAPLPGHPPGHLPGHPMAPRFDLSVGLILLAAGITGAMFGFATSQFVYYIKYYWRSDRLFLRIIVSLLWALDLFHFGLFSNTVYVLAVFRRSLINAKLPWTGTAQILANACLVAVVQLFYLHRIWGLSRHPMLVLVLGMISTANFALAINLMVQITLVATTADFQRLKNFDVALSAVTAASDILITVALVTLLLMSRRKGSRNNRLIHRLMFYPINTGILTSLCAILSLVTIITKPATNLYVFFYYIGARLYAICMIASLNARESLRHGLANNGISSIPPIRTYAPQSGNRLAGLAVEHHSVFTTQKTSRSGSDSHGHSTVHEGPKLTTVNKACALGEGHPVEELRLVHSVSLPKT